MKNALIADNALFALLIFKEIHSVEYAPENKFVIYTKEQISASIRQEIAMILVLHGFCKSTVELKGISYTSQKGSWTTTRILVKNKNGSILKKINL